MENIRFLSQTWFEKTVANNLQLLSEITATAACGIWLQPQKTSNQLWVSASFFKLTSNDETLMTVIKSLRNYGRMSFAENSYAGFNSRLDTLQAAFLSEKLKNLNAENLRRRAIATRYLAEIKNSKITLPFWDTSARHVFHLFVVLVENREHFTSYLKHSEVGFGVHYTIPPYQQKALKAYNHLKFPLTEKVAQTCVSIPLNPTLDDEEVTQIIGVLNKYNA